jgi:hypothetical protein
MGWLDKFRKGGDPAVTHFRQSVVRSFSLIKEDMALQRQWIAYLNNLHGTLSDAHHTHRELTTRDLDELKRWINLLQANTERHDTALKQFETNLSKTVSAYNAFLLHLHNEVKGSRVRETELRRRIVDEVTALLVQHKRDLQTEISHQRPEHEPKAEEHSLSNPEQKLLNVLLSQSDPVSYQALAEKTGNSVNTVRVIMNNLRKRGLVEEHLLPTGIKLWNAANKERVKKLYNLS